MPPKAKFTKEEVISAALAIVREKGKDGLTARELGAKLSSSARPIFTLFSGMDEVMQETERAAREVYNGYVREGLKAEKPFKGVGTAYIRFAAEEPQLFRILYMSEVNSPITSILPEIDENYPAILKSITDTYPLSHENAEKLYEHLWVYSHGIATMCACSSCAFTKEDISRMLTEVCSSLIKSLLEKK